MLTIVACREGQLLGEWSYRKRWGRGRLQSIEFGGASGFTYALSTQGQVYVIQGGRKDPTIALQLKVWPSLQAKRDMGFSMG